MIALLCPRQTGKTTALKALVREINEKGESFALYCSLETLQNRSDPEKTNIAIRDLIADNVEMSPFYVPVPNAPELRSDRGGVGLAVRAVLQNVCRASGKKVVVFFDEADCLIGDALISFLRQLRDGYVNRDVMPFPKSVALVGMLDVRDYKAQIRPDGESLGQISPFNIIRKDLLIPNFAEAEQCAKYLETLKLSEGWMPIFDKSKTKTWDEKIYGIITMKERREGADWFKIPNVCVKRQMFDYLRRHYEHVRSPNWQDWARLARAFAYRGEWRPFLERLAADFADTTPVRGGIQGEHRIQGYMQAEFGHLDFYLMAPEMELSRGFCDFCLFPERYRSADVPHSYLVELKFSKADASEADIAAKYQEGLDQLAKYRADKSVPTLARGTTLHQIVFQFKGSELVRIEQVAEEPMP